MAMGRKSDAGHRARVMRSHPSARCSVAAHRTGSVHVRRRAGRDDVSSLGARATLGHLAPDAARYCRPPPAGRGSPYEARHIATRQDSAAPKIRWPRFTTGSRKTEARPRMIRARSPPSRSGSSPAREGCSTSKSERAADQGRLKYPVRVASRADRAQSTAIRRCERARARLSSLRATRPIRRIAS